ncbi:MAG TPA: Rpn family recombination-promoting nuclease/putative transposase, partial [Candidatus Eisenbergiella intestinipullorum]|nr:Rpn family recombination-promoting nuclease/putative transposase [Candidatus Eisenbergiella intestinipullorum]
MGEKNDAFCTFMERADIFADFINGTVFGGRREVAPEELEAVPGIYHAEKHTDRRRGTGGRYRDVAKKRCREGTCCVLTVENQNELHYAMPARCMEYDALEYAGQLRKRRTRHRREKDLKGSAQFLSGLTPEEKLDPVVTLVFYHGKKSWEASCDLHGMLNFEGANEMFRKYTANYRMNLYTLEDLREEYFTTGFRDVIGVMINHKKMDEYKEKNRTEGGKVNMCKEIRRGCKIFCVYGNETFQIRIRYVVVFVGFCSRIFCRIYLSGYSIS